MVDGQRRSNARLHDGIAFHNAPIASAEPWPIKRMRHSADQTGGSTPWQARVCIECNHVTNTREVCWGAPADRHKGGARGTAQELVQLMQFSSLALPAHPFAVALIPYS